MKVFGQDAGERESGYFSRAWDWESQKKNAGFIVRFNASWK